MHKLVRRQADSFIAPCILAHRFLRLCFGERCHDKPTFT